MITNEQHEIDLQAKIIKKALKRNKPYMIRLIKERQPFVLEILPKRRKGILRKLSEEDREWLTEQEQAQEHER